MKLTIERAQLLKSLAHVQSVVERRNTIPILSNVLIEAKGVTQAQTAKEAGIAESTISEVLAGKRKLNRTQIGKLARYPMSGGLIRNAALRATWLAAEEQSPLLQIHVERAIRAQLRELGRLTDNDMSD